MSNFERAISKWKKLLELSHFDIEWSMRHSGEEEKLSEDDPALINIQIGERRLEIIFNKDNKKDWNEELVVHELAHVILFRLWDFVDQMIRKNFQGEDQKRARATLKAQYESLEEEIVDNLVRIFIKLKVTTHTTRKLIPQKAKKRSSKKQKRRKHQKPKKHGRKVRSS